ncbi:response regulator transcription factor [Fervidibacillus halotolerans]|uniref:Response regulator transcription factor n=1 Tax=Fervidibacillus halotolerans TaxID=2980027 RepID=A0A9E8RXU7_9BACI|nr:response regulator transcription factor [Fervidibacillus halotolerans]WAA13125.1 response regulator transcription factor [Fervidibacillus halotolerans]
MNVLIVDDHEIVREGLALLLKDAFPIQSLKFASEGREAIQKAFQNSFDLVLLDLSMPDGLDGLLTLKELRGILPKAKIVIFSMYDEVEYQMKAMEYGADGYLVKRFKSDEIIHYLQSILKGEKIVNGKLYTNQPIKEDDNWKFPLSPREQEVFILTVKGYTQKEIAETMHISIRTVENHRRSISKKLGTKNKSEWLKMAQKYKLLDL